MVSFEEWLRDLDISQEEFDSLGTLMQEELRTEYLCEFPEVFNQQNK